MNLNERKGSKTNSRFRLFDYSIIRLFPVSIIRLFDYSIIRKSARGFTLIELMVVVGMIMVLVGALTSSTTAARKRARVQKATADVKLITQAILAYEQWAAKNGKPMRTYDQPVECDSGNLDFLLGKETDGNGGNIPVLLMAQLQSGGKLMDPWGHPYMVTIKEGNAQVKWSSGSVRTGYQLPNYYRVTPGERPIEER